MQLDLTKGIPFQSNYRCKSEIITECVSNPPAPVCQGFVYRLSAGESITFPDNKQFAVPPRRDAEFTTFTSVLVNELRLSENKLSAFKLLLNLCEKFCRFTTTHLRSDTLDLTIPNPDGLGFQLSRYGLGESVSFSGVPGEAFRINNVCKPFAIRETTCSVSRTRTTHLTFERTKHYELVGDDDDSIRRMQAACLVGVDRAAFLDLVHNSLLILRDCIDATNPPKPAPTTAPAPVVQQPLRHARPTLPKYQLKGTPR